MAVGASLQKGLYEHLVAALDVPVFDHVPQGREYPFVVIGDTDLRAWESYESMGYVAEARIHCYTATAGRLAVNELLDDIEDALNRAELVLPDYGGSVVTVHMIFRSPAVEPDGVVRSGRIDFRAIIGGE